MEPENKVLSGKYTLVTWVPNNLFCRGGITDPRLKLRSLSIAENSRGSLVVWFDDLNLRKEILHAFFISTNF